MLRLLRETGFRYTSSACEFKGCGEWCLVLEGVQVGGRRRHALADVIEAPGHVERRHGRAVVILIFCGQQAGW